MPHAARDQVLASTCPGRDSYSHIEEWAVRCLGSADISNIQLSPNGELKLHSRSDDIGDMPILLHELN